MTIQNAFDIISKQLQKNKQNIELLELLQEAVDLYDLMQNEEYDYSMAKKYVLGKGYDKE